METNSIRFRVDSLIMNLELCVEKSDEYRQCIFRDELLEVWANEKALKRVDRLFFTFNSKKKIDEAEKIYKATVDLCKIPRLEKIYLYVHQLVAQVYQFSRMYWKSVSQQNLPVTVKYPEMMAQIIPFFNSKVLPAFGKKNLWFI